MDKNKRNKTLSFGPVDLLMWVRCVEEIYPAVR